MLEFMEEETELSAQSSSSEALSVVDLQRPQIQYKDMRERGRVDMMRGGSQRI